MNGKEADKTEKYFAAANGYNGFRSYFDEVFASRDYRRIIVLKGGPGTGKSSFMRKIKASFDEGFDIEEIYCSSDPNSLDGVIVKSEHGRVAVLDGTAPHERDARIPGAIDEIVDLGCLWSKEWLTAKREKILNLSLEKAKAYKTAYACLSVAGCAQRESLKLSAIPELSSASKALLRDFASSIAQKGEGKKTTRLVSSFGRYGHYRLTTLEGVSKRIISLKGSTRQKQGVMKHLFRCFEDIDSDIILFPTALNEAELEAIHLNANGISIVTEEGGEPLDCNEFIKESSEIDRARTEALEVGITKAALGEAERWFSIASDLHFRLEEIYTAAMNFNNFDEIVKNNAEMLRNIFNSLG